MENLKPGEKIRLTMSDGSVYTGEYMETVQRFGFIFVRLNHCDAHPLFNMLHIVSYQVIEKE